MRIAYVVAGVFASQGMYSIGAQVVLACGFSYRRLDLFFQPA